MRRDRGHRHLRLPVACASILLLAAAAGCSSSSSTSQSSGQNSSGSSANLGTVKVGTIVPLTGAGPQYPEILAGAEAAVKAFNSSGGVDGHQLQLVSCDDQNNLNQGLACAREMVQDHIIALVGNYGNYGPEETPILVAAGIPEIGEATIYSANQYNSPNEFMLDAGTFTQFVPQVVYAMQTLHSTKLSCAAAAVAIAAAICDTAKSAADVLSAKWTGTTQIPITATDYAPYVAAANSQGAQFVDIADSAEAVIQYASSAEQTGASFRLALSALSNTTSDLQKLNPSTSFGSHILFGSPVPPVSAAAQYPLLNTFKADMAAEASTGNSNASPSSYSIGQEQEWFAFYAFSQVAKLISGKTLTAATLMAELKVAKNVQLGLIPPWTPNATGPKNFSRVSEPIGFVLGISNGQYSLVSPSAVNLEQFLKASAG
jgi:ABC-type branched-subunit amino acid transport system substrate-binding protein